MGRSRRILKKALESGLGSGAYRLLQGILRLMPEPGGYRLARFLGGVSRPPGNRERMLRMMKTVLGPDTRTEEEWALLMDSHMRWIGHSFVEIH